MERSYRPIRSEGDCGDRWTGEQVLKRPSAGSVSDSAIKKMKMATDDLAFNDPRLLALPASLSARLDGWGPELRSQVGFLSRLGETAALHHDAGFEQVD